MGDITATIVCSFGGGAGDSMLVAEWDDTKNDDKTSFLTTETAFFAIYKYPSTLIVDTPVPTSGMVIEAGSVTRTKTETLEFVGTKELSLSHPPDGAVNVDIWYGNIGEGFTVSGFHATITSSFPCICKVTYQTTGALWELFPPNGIDLEVTPSWPIAVWITAHETI